MLLDNIYKGYSDLPTFNFYEIIETANLNWFFKDYNGEDVEMEQDVREGFTQKMYDIYDERIEYLGDVKTEMYFKKLAEIDALQTKYQRVIILCSTIVQIPLKNKYFIQYVDELKEEGFKFGKPVTTIEEKGIYFDFLDSKLKGLKNKLNIKKAQNKEFLVDTNKKRADLVRDKIILNEIIPNQIIDLRVTPIKEWDALCKRASEKTKKG